MYKTVMISVFVLLIGLNNLFAQSRDPIWDALGVSDEVLSQIDNAIESRMGYSYAISPMNMDSVIGDPNQGGRQDPFGTLKNCYVFAANATSQSETEPHGLIGVFRGGQLVWHSDRINTVEYSTTGFIIGTRDLNKDGNVEILTSWKSGPSTGTSFLWIFSWDGNNGNLITDKDTRERSIVKSTSGGEFRIVDVDGDGIFEIQGDTLKDENETIYETVTYSWNGQNYGIWPDTPQVKEGYFYPRDLINVTFTANIQKNVNDLFTYKYVIKSLESSSQKINQVLLEKPINTFASVKKPRNWSFIAYEKVLNWQANPFGNENYFRPGVVDSSISYLAGGLPTIVQYYILGDNPRPSGISGKEWFENVKVNSANGFTLGAGPVPIFFNSVIFTDSLHSYTTQACELEWITNKGTCTSLQKKLDNVKKQLERGNAKTASNVLQAFINEVEAQKDKHLTSEGYGLLYFNAVYLREQLNK